MSLSSLNARFLALAATTLAITLIALYTSGDGQAIVALLKILLPMLAIIGVLLLLTRHYWLDARRVR